MLGKTHSSSSVSCVCGLAVTLTRKTACLNGRDRDSKGIPFIENPSKKVESFSSKIFEPQKIIQQETPNNPEISNYSISPFNFTTQPGCSLVKLKGLQLPRLKFTARTSSFHRTHHKEPWHGVGHMTTKTQENQWINRASFIQMNRL